MLSVQKEPHLLLLCPRMPTPVGHSLPVGAAGFCGMPVSKDEDTPVGVCLRVCEVVAEPSPRALNARALSLGKQTERIPLPEWGMP